MIKRFQHARARAMERYGFDLTHDLHRQLCDSVRNGEAFKLGRLTNTRAIYEVHLYGQRVRFIYSRASKCIVTFVIGKHLRKMLRRLDGEEPRRHNHKRRKPNHKLKRRHGGRTKNRGQNRGRSTLWRQHRRGELDEDPYPYP